MNRLNLLDCLYPNKCAVCGEITGEIDPVCEYCKIVINNVNHKNLCPKCGLEREYCRCKSREYHFKGIAGTFKNSGAPQRAYYAYKLGKHKELADFFAERVYRTVKTVFGDIHFDAICCVPTAHRSRLKRGFDHNEEIAVRLADKFGSRYLRGVLKARHFRNFQHRSSFAKRLENVRGKYYTVSCIKANRVLLFDDILTTGATLDECAKELMFAGVKEVYCAVVLETYPKKKTNGGK